MRGTRSRSLTNASEQGSPSYAGMAAVIALVHSSRPSAKHASLGLAAQAPFRNNLRDRFEIADASPSSLSA